MAFIKCKNHPSITAVTERMKKLGNFTVSFSSNIPVGVYMFKVNNRNTRKRCEIGSKLTIKAPERGHWRRSGVLLLTSNIFHTLF